MLLQVGEPRRLIALARLISAGLILGLAASLALAFAEHFLERPHFAEEQIPLRPPRSAVRTNVLGPNKPREQLVRFRLLLFEAKDMLERSLLPARRRLPQLDVFRLRPAARNRWEFMLTVGPLPIPNGTGSPVNPLAIF